jgi:hypothetical protein
MADWIKRCLDRDIIADRISAVSALQCHRHITDSDAMEKPSGRFIVWPSVHL